METKFIEQLVTTAPESLREITHTLRVDVEALLKAKSTKKFLVLEPYSHNTELCRHILRQMEQLPELPSVSCREYQPLLMLLSLSKEVEIQNDLLHHFVEPYRKAYRTPEMVRCCIVPVRRNPCTICATRCVTISLWNGANRSADSTRPSPSWTSSLPRNG